jgi:hypothetical protein
LNICLKKKKLPGLRDKNGVIVIDIERRRNIDLIIPCLDPDWDGDEK